jgi:hypothetical protein
MAAIMKDDAKNIGLPTAGDHADPAQWSRLEAGRSDDLRTARH